MDIKGNNYLISSLRFGLGLTGNAKRFRWNCSAGADYFVVGRNEEVTSTFQGAANQAFANKEFQSRSVTIDALQAECDLDHISEGIEVYAAAN